MSDQSWWELVIAGVALLLMAVAATVEATATLISRHRLRHLAEQRGRLQTVQELLDPRRSLVASLRLVGAIALATAASLLTTVALREFDVAEHVVAIVVVAAFFLVFGQALPRALASTQPERAAGLLLTLAGFFSLIAWPFTELVDRSAHLLRRLLPGPPATAPIATEDELRGLALDGPDDGVIEAAERAMIDNVLHLEETSARDIMVPRVDIVAVDEAATASEIVARITGAGHTRLPVYRETIDQIIGILHAKDLLPFAIGATEQVPLAQLLRPVYVVPESKRIDDLLTELRRNRIQMAIVADEYGGTAGLVTIEDIIEEIVGEIHDEYDVERPLVERLSDDELIADGRLPLEDVAEALGLSFGGDDEGTVAGFVHRHLGRLPVEGDRFAAEGLIIEVIAVEGRRLRQLRLARRGPPPTDAPDAGGDSAASETPADDAAADRAPRSPPA